MLSPYRSLFSAFILASPYLLLSCNSENTSEAEGASALNAKAIQKKEGPWKYTSNSENITNKEIAENSTLEFLDDQTLYYQKHDIHAQIKTLIEAGDTAALDVLAKSLLETKERDDHGHWMLKHFYNAFKLRDNLPTALWDLRTQFLQDWIKDSPDSQTAKIALASHYVDYAWRARGSGWAKDVTDDGWRLMGERLGYAEEILVDAIETLDISDPTLFDVGTRLMIGLGSPPTLFDEFTAASLETAPAYWHTLHSRAYSLLPRWHGETGDWEAFGEYIAKHNEPYGKEQFALITIGRHAFRTETVSMDRLNWKLLKEGLQELLKNYPNSVTNISRAAFLATVAGDQAFAKECFDLLGERCAPSIWKVNGRMIHYRNWANTGVW